MLIIFNELAALFQWDEVINSYCRDIQDCEKTVDLIYCITQRMKKLIKIM